MNRTRLFALVGLVAIAVAACSSDTKVAEGARPARTADTKDHDAGHDMSNMSPAEKSSHDHAATEVDDRGFAALENGEEHGHGFTQAVADADRAELARQLVLARETALQYPTVADAEAAGLRRAGPFSPGLGAHYINYQGAAGDTDGVMSDDDIRSPIAWIYDGTKPESRVAGLFYTTPVKDSVGFAGPNDIWHVHRNICIVAGANGIDTPLGADRAVTKAQCTKVGGNLLEETGYLLHVWVVPGYESPEGVFSHLSSAVTCDDGTYEIIPDPTEIGTRTSMCPAGTE